jgi:hypothetical protein
LALQPIDQRLVAGGQPSCRVSKGTLIATCADGELGFEFRSEPSDLPLQVDTALDPRDTAVEIVEPDAHRGDVTFDGGQSHDRFVELTLDAVEPSVNAAQVKQPDIFSVLWGIFVLSHDRAYTPVVVRGGAVCRRPRDRL